MKKRTILTPQKVKKEVEEFKERVAGILGDNLNCETYNENLREIIKQIGEIYEDKLIDILWEEINFYKEYFYEP